MNTGDILRLHMKILEDTNLSFEQKVALFDEVRKVMPAEQNRWTLRWIIWFLGAAVISAPLYALVQFVAFHWGTPVSMPTGTTLSDIRDIPAALLSIASTALGALATFLTHYVRAARGGSASSSEPTSP
jgi:hypothetical protein